MSNRNIFLFDKQVALVANVSVSYISSLFKQQDKANAKKVNKPHHKNKEVDLRKCNPIAIAGGRRWDPQKVAEVLGITLEQLYSVID